jgi:hypothetical protein
MDGLTVDTNTLYVDSTNNRVGVGTTSPDTLLEIVGANPILTVRDTETSSSSTSTTLRLAESGGGDSLGTYWDIKHNPNAALSFLAGTTERLRIDSSGRVGIGTSSPSDTLSVNGQIGFFGNDGQLKFNDGSAIKGGNNYGDIRIQTDRFRVYNEAGSNLAMNIDSSGRVLLNRTAATGSLTLESQAPSGFSVGSGFYSSATGSTIEFKDSNTTANYKVRIGAYTDDMVMFAGGSERMRLDSSGNLGIGTASPSRELEVTGSGNVYVKVTAPTANDSAGIELANTGATWLIQNDDTSSEALTFDRAGTERMRIDSSGHLLVGTTSSTPTGGGFAFRSGTVGHFRTSHASGTASGNWYQAFYLGASVIGTITQAGTTGVNYNTSSDQRLKENIADANDAGSKIDAIQVRQYDWKADGSHQDYGLIAQELVEVAPEAVTVPADSEEMMGVDYSKLVPMLIKEIQSLRNRVAQLEE